MNDVVDSSSERVSEHARNTAHQQLWNGVKFIDRDSHWYTRTVKEAIHIRLHPDKLNSDSGIKIPKAWMTTIKKHNNRRAVRQRTAERAARIETRQSQLWNTNQSQGSIILYKKIRNQSTSSPDED